jgi:hypothetical protein
MGAQNANPLPRRREEKGFALAYLIVMVCCDVLLDRMRVKEEGTGAVATVG